MTTFFDEIESVQDLIDVLNKVKDKKLPVRLELKHDLENDDMENYWITSATMHETGRSGYEVEGEVVLHD